MFNRLFLFIIMLITAMICFAVSTMPAIPTGGGWQEWLGFGLAIVSLLLIEIVLRLIKTEKNKSLILLVAKILDFIVGILIPNRSKNIEGKHKIE